MADKIKKIVEIEIDFESGDVNKLNKELKSSTKESAQLTGTLYKMSGGPITDLFSMVTGV